MHAQIVGDAPPNPRSVEAQPIEVQSIFRFANDDRAAQGLPPLAWSPDLAAAAHAHAQLMADNGTLSHRYTGEAELTARAAQSGAHFASIAENIATGHSARQIDQEWMHSMPHRTNILDPHMNALGVAVVQSAGMLYAVEDFASSVEMLPPAGAEQKVAAELQSLQPGLTLAAPDDARQSCPLADGAVAGSHARFVLHWEGSQLTLPQPLADAARSGKYTAASVGACPPSSGTNAGFTTYRIAVLLY
jgi:hypothetical protein